MKHFACVLLFLASCVGGPPAIEGDVVALEAGVGALRVAFVNQTATLGQLIDEAERRGAPADTVTELRRGREENAQQFGAAHRAVVELLVDLGRFTIRDALEITGATAAEIEAWRAQRAVREIMRSSGVPQ